MKETLALKMSKLAIEYYWWWIIHYRKMLSKQFRQGKLLTSPKMIHLDNKATKASMRANIYEKKYGKIMKSIVHKNFLSVMAE